MASSATAVPSGLALKVEWVEPGGKIGRVDQLFLGPDAGERVQAVGHGLAEDDHVRLHAEMLDRPQLAGPVEAHLDLVDDQQDAVLVEHLLQLDEEVGRRDDVAAGALQRLDIEGGVFGLPVLGPRRRCIRSRTGGRTAARSARRTPPCSCPWGRGNGTGTGMKCARSPKWPKRRR
jgi:hypothetical protein